MAARSTTPTSPEPLVASRFATLFQTTRFRRLASRPSRASCSTTIPLPPTRPLASNDQNAASSGSDTNRYDIRVDESFPAQTVSSDATRTYAPRRFQPHPSAARLVTSTSIKADSVPSASRGSPPLRRTCSMKRAHKCSSLGRTTPPMEAHAISSQILASEVSPTRPVCPRSKSPASSRSATRRATPVYRTINACSPCWTTSTSSEAGTA